MTTLARAASARAEQERRRYDVCCVGNALMDHLAYADLATVAALGLDHGGMTLVDIATTDQLKAVIGNGRQVPGGTVTNTAVGVASLGGRPVFIGAVATDETGDQYAADLEAAGVHAVLQRFPFDPDGHEMATGRCYVIVTPDAERTMATALGVGGQLNAAGVDEAVIAQSMLVYFDGYVLDLPDARALVDRLLGAGRAAGTAVAVGLADSRLVERHRGVLEDLCREGVEYIFANESEILEFTKTSGVDRAVRAVARDDLVVAVTRGARGATVGFDHCVVDVPAHLVENVADVTGAGDLFAAGFCYGVTHGLDPVAAAELGSLAAAEVISHLGARPETSLADLARARSLI
ncbi:MAG: adenosine kinase [Acidimicrobiales bacterium]